MSDIYRGKRQIYGFFQKKKKKKDRYIGQVFGPMKMEIGT